MTIEPFDSVDIVPFLKLAAGENWVAEPWEFEHILAEFPQGCFSAVGDFGERAGFVTALRHDRSGWIGNLIVAEHMRGFGVGEALFRKALEALQLAGVKTVWLTASKSGRSLYERYGFSSVDTVIRWVGTGRQRHAARAAIPQRAALAGSSYDLDAQGWGDRRETLLDRTAGRGWLQECETGFIVQQPCGDAVQFGPFSAADTGSADRLFEEASRAVTLGTKFLLDAPVSNRAALRLFNRRNMRIAGSNILMYAGKKPEYRPELIYGLATMGSCG